MRVLVCRTTTQQRQCRIGHRAATEVTTLYLLCPLLCFQKCSERQLLTSCVTSARCTDQRRTELTVFDRVQNMLKIPRTIRMLTQHGADALRPCLLNGRYARLCMRSLTWHKCAHLLSCLCRYIKPLVSPRVAATFRKRAIIEGTFGSFVANEGLSASFWHSHFPRRTLPPCAY